MATNLGTIYAELALKTDKLNRGLVQAEKKFAATGKKMAAVGQKLSLMVTLPLLGMGAAASAAAMSIDNAYDAIRIGTGATGEQLKRLEENFRNTFRVVPLSAREVALVIADLNTRLGITGIALEQLAVRVGRTAHMMGVDSAALVREFTRVMGDWGVTVEQSARTLDMLFVTSQATGIGITQLAAKLVQFGAPLRKMGFGLEQSAALMGKWEREGVNAELVLGSLRIALGEFARQGVTDTNRALLALIGRVQQAGSVGEATALAMEYFGVRAGPDMAAAIREGRFALGDLVVQLQRSSGAIESAYRDTHGLAEMWIEFRNTTLLALEPLGKKLLQLAEAWLPRMIRAVTSLAEGWARLAPWVRTTILGLIGLVAVTGPLLLVTGNLIGAYFTLTAALTAVKAAAAAAGISVGKLIWLKAVAAGKVLVFAGAALLLVRTVVAIANAFRGSSAATQAATTQLQAQDAIQQAAARTGYAAAKAQEDLGKATEKAAKAAGKNIMAFDQVHQLQEDMAGAGARTVQAPRVVLPEIVPVAPILEQAAKAVDDLVAAGEKVNQTFSRLQGVLGVVGHLISGVLMVKIAKLAYQKSALGLVALKSAAQVALAWGKKTAAALTSLAAQSPVFLALKAKWAALGATAGAKAAQVAAAWVVKQVTALASLAAQVPVFLALGAKWVGMAATAVAKAAIIAGAWLVMQTSALTGLAVQVPAFAALGAKWVALGLGATLNAAKVVGAWVLMQTRALANLAMQAPVFLALGAKWAGLAVAAAASAAKVAGAWLLMQAKALPSLAAHIPTFLALGARWVGLAATATAKAVKMAAAWLIALGPVGWVTGVVAGLVAAIILNWTQISDRTRAIWGSLSQWLGGRWIAIRDAAVNAFSGMRDSLAAVWERVVGSVHSLQQRVVERFQGMVTGVRNIAATATSAIAEPFERARARVENVTNAIRGFLQRINPLARQSPSLVDNIRAGVESIQREYAKLERLHLPSVVGAVPLSPKHQPTRGMQSHRGDFEMLAQTVHAAVRDALHASPAAGGVQRAPDIVLELDGIQFGRVALPMVIREGQRLGISVVGV